MYLAEHICDLKGRVLLRHKPHCHHGLVQVMNLGVVEILCGHHVLCVWWSSADVEVDSSTDVIHVHGVDGFVQARYLVLGHIIQLAYNSISDRLPRELEFSREGVEIAYVF